jgi:hypothetical protein
MQHCNCIITSTVIFSLQKIAIKPFRKYKHHLIQSSLAPVVAGLLLRLTHLLASRIPNVGNGVESDAFFSLTANRSEPRTNKWAAVDDTWKNAVSSTKLSSTTLGKTHFRRLPTLGQPPFVDIIIIDDTWRTPFRRLNYHRLHLDKHIFIDLIIIDNTWTTAILSTYINIIDFTWTNDISSTRIIIGKT